jgi:hypothetical protein
MAYHLRLALPAAVVLLLAAHGCSSETPAPIIMTASAEAGAPRTENTLAACSDRVDNDGDGAVDCDDPDCKVLVQCADPEPAPVPPEPPPRACPSCNDSLPCTTDACDSTTGTCTHTAKQGSCAINGACYTAGAKNGTQCQICDPTVKGSAWTPIVGGCIIGGYCYRPGDRDPTGCNVCDPTRSVSTWSTFPGTACTTAGPKCYAAGERDVTNCEVCDPGFSKVALKADPLACTIGGKCYAQGAHHPSYTCGSVTCNNAVTTTAWTVSGEECLIGSICYAAGETDATGCNACIPSQSRTAFSAGTYGCKIGGYCYDQGEKYNHPTCTSAVCDSSVSTSSWTVAGDECLISGVCYQAGDKTNNSCSECKPSDNKTSWTTITGGCTISSICYPSGAKHPSSTCQATTCDPLSSTSTWTSGNECLIGGTCYAANALDGNSCKKCDPTQSKTDWTTLSTSCVIGGTCYPGGTAYTSNGCGAYNVTCDAAQNASAWTVGADACLINGACYANGAKDPTGCSRCDTSQSKTKWTAEPSCTNIVIAALNEGHNGALGGLAGADNLCATQAAAAGRGGTWKALLSSAAQDVVSLITGSNATDKAVVNLRNQPLYASWSALFPVAGSAVQWNAATSYLYSFEDRAVYYGAGAVPEYYLNRLWTGSTGAGAKTTYNCNNWDSSSSGYYGTYTRLDTPYYRYLNYYTGSTNNCASTLVVACVAIPPAPPDGGI